MLLKSYTLKIEFPPCDFSAQTVNAIAELSDDISEVMPYLNTIVEGCTYLPKNNILRFNQQGKVINLYPKMIAVAKLKDRREAEQVIESLKVLINDTYERRGEIKPSYEGATELKVRDIYNLLPGTNCRQCELPTCFAFAAKLIKRQVDITKCTLFTQSSILQKKRDFWNCSGNMAICDYLSEGVEARNGINRKEGNRMGIVTLAILFVVGILAGGVGGLLGIGGCVLMMPVIRFGFNFSPALAVGTTLTAVVFTAASGAIMHWRLGNVDWGAIKYIAPAGVIGVIIGSVVFYFISGYGKVYFISGYGKVIDLIVGLAFLPAAARMLYEGILQRTRAEVPGDKILGSNSTKAGIGGGVGFLTGIIGLGGGYALVPSFIYITRSPLRIAIGSSMAAFVWFALVGAAIKIFQGFTDILSAIVLGIGAAGGAIVGARLVARFKPATLKAVFGFIFLYVSLKYILLFFGIQI